MAFNNSPMKKIADENTSKYNKERQSHLAFSWYNTSELHKEHNEIRKEAQLKSWSENNNK